MINNLGKILSESPYKREVIQKHMGISRNTLSNWATGHTTPTVRDLFKLAHYLDKKVDEFYIWEKDDETLKDGRKL